MTPSKGWVLEVAGVIQGFMIQKGTSGRYDTPVIYLKGGKDSFGGVRCDTAKDEPWAFLSHGQNVTLRGRCSKYDFSLTSCFVVNAGPSTRIEISAEEITREAKEDYKAFEKKYERKPVMVHGIVAKFEINKNGLGDGELEGSDMGRVQFHMLADFTSAAKRWKPGERVGVAGSLDYFASGPVVIQHPMPVSKKNLRNTEK